MYKFIPKRNMVSSRPIVQKNQKVVRALDVVQDDFIVNKFGHIRSDFAILTDSCNSQEFARALAQMQSSYQSSSSQFDGMTFEQMVAMVRPRWCQLPGEVDRFEQYLIDNALDFYKQLREDAETVAQLNNPGEPPLPPATIGGTTQPSE